MSTATLIGAIAAEQWIASGKLPRCEVARIRRAILTHMGGGIAPDLRDYETVGVNADGSRVVEIVWRGSRLTLLLREGRNPLDPHPDVWVLAVEDHPTRVAEPIYLAPMRSRVRRAGSPVHARLLRLEPLIFDAARTHHITASGPTGPITFSPDNRMMFHPWLASWDRCGPDGVLVVCRRTEPLRDAATGKPYVRIAAALIDRHGHVHYAPKDRLARVCDAEFHAGPSAPCAVLSTDGRTVLGALGD